MRKTFLSLSLVIAMCFAATPLMAEESQPAKSEEKAFNPIEQFTGKYWQESTQTNKEAYLFGIESAIAVDYFIAQEESKKSKRHTSNALSKFDQGWIKAFQDVPRQQIATEVDNWYKDHPEELNRPVLATIWYELIEPRIKSVK